MASERSCFSSGCSLFYNMVMFEGSIISHLDQFYQDNPIGARIIATPIGLVAGIVKVVIFPAICAIGILAMPIIAIQRAYQGKPEWGARLSTWCFCLMGLAAYATFIVVTTFHVPLNASTGLVITFLSFSISLHVYEYVKEPTPIA